MNFRENGLFSRFSRFSMNPEKSRQFSTGFFRSKKAFSLSTNVHGENIGIQNSLTRKS